MVKKEPETNDYKATAKIQNDGFRHDPGHHRGRHINMNSSLRDKYSEEGDPNRLESM